MNATRTLLSLSLLALGLSACGSNLKAAVRNDIDRQIRERQPAFAECYKALLERDKTARGTLVLSFQVPASSTQVGQVLVVSSTIPEPVFQQCIATKAQGLRLVESHSRPLDVSYPVSFQPL
jgi:hypothetical protein